MTTDRRFEHDLPDLLADLFIESAPTYRDDVLRRTADVQQRPAWSFPERWFPMSVMTLARQTFQPLPWRTIALLAALAVLVAGSLALYVGSRPRVPAPFGPAANGLLAYAADGDIYTVDPISAAVTPVITGPELDSGPVWSLDGMRFAFVRQDQLSRPGSLYVAGADGTDLTLVTPEPALGIQDYAFSPDGSQVVFAFTQDGVPTIATAATDGSGVRSLDVGMPAVEPAYRPATGSEILFVGTPDGSPAAGLYVVQPDGSGLRTIVQPANTAIERPRWSPDGASVAYTAWHLDYNTNPQASLARAWVVSADGRTNRVVHAIPAEDLNSAEGWSNDGTRLLVMGTHYPTEGDPGEGTGVVVRMDGSAPPLQIDVDWVPVATERIRSIWAPDDLSIVSVPFDATGRPMRGSVILDAVSGQSRAAPWLDSFEPSWQRLAP
jgi:dipeptidyl aminopeptidase/acylaminoacyl peptidase